MDKLILQYMLGKPPLFGAHLSRGETLTDRDMVRALENGVIEQVGTRGYVLTDKGRGLAQAKPTVHG